MNLNRLRAFAAVIEYGSFSAAARHLGLSQPGISQQVKALEKELGAHLLERGTNGVRLTDTGTVVFEHTQRILQEWESLIITLDQASTDKKRRLRVGASSVPATYVLPDILYAFRTANPTVDLTMEVSDSDTVVRWVQDDQVDIGATGSKPPDDGLEYLSIAGDRLVLIGPPERQTALALNPQDLLREEFVWREEGSGTRSVTEAGLRDWGIDPRKLKINAELGTTDSVVGAVQAGIGVAFVSERAVRSATAAGRLSVLTVDAPVIERAFYLAWPTKKSSDPIIIAFVQAAAGRDTKGGSVDIHDV